MSNIQLFNDDINYIFTDVGNMEGFEYPEVINVIDDISGMGGALYVTSKFGRRRLSWEGLIRSDVQESRRDLIQSVRAGNLKTIKFATCDGVEVQADIEVEKVLMPYKNGRTKYLIEAVAPDWRFFSQTLHSVEFETTTVYGGLSIPATIPMSFSGAGASSNILNNAGTEIANPTFLINGAGTKFTIGNQTTGEQFVIEYTLTGSQYIEVSTLNRTILLNGVTPIYSSLITGDFWSIAPGDNTITFLATGKDASTLLTIQYRDAYLGI